MKNEKVISKGNGTATRKRKAAATPQGIGRMGIGTQQARRCKGNHPQQSAPRAVAAFADGFLRQQYLPMYAPYREAPPNNDIDKGVLHSLANLAGAFNFQPFEANSYAYPYNVMLAYNDAEKQMKRKNKDLELFIMEADNGSYAMATMETASRSYDLYYIPVRPLFRLMKSGKSKLAENLLLAVFSYLYHIARVPGHRDEETFLHYHTEMVSDWIEDECGWDEEDNTDLKAAIKRAEYEGDFVQKRYWHSYHLENFASTVANAKPKTELEHQTLKIATDYLKLWQQYPERNIFQNLRLSDGRTECDEDEDYYSTIYAHEYIHFIHDMNDVLYSNIETNVQTEFNEKVHSQEHSLLRLYDDSIFQNNESLDYETRFFKLADDLCYLLTNTIK